MFRISRNGQEPVTNVVNLEEIEPEIRAHSPSKKRRRSRTIILMTPKNLLWATGRNYPTQSRPSLPQK
jgi:hypothetical protein